VAEAVLLGFERGLHGYVVWPKKAMIVGAVSVQTSAARVNWSIMAASVKSSIWMASMGHSEAHMPHA
jgi:hypothetical protein